MRSDNKRRTNETYAHGLPAITPSYRATHFASRSGAPRELVSVMLDTGCQVCGLVYSPTTREIVSTHRCAYRGGPNPICVWKYPSLEMIANLPGHIER